MAEQWPKLDSCTPHHGHVSLDLGDAVPTSKAKAGELSICPRYSLNANVNQYLRGYQREGVQWLWKQYKLDRGGI